MKTLVFFTGLRGAGKTSILAGLKNHGTVLQPSTTRPMREGETSEYDFVEADAWDTTNLAWSIDVGGYHYGMRLSEIERLPIGGIGLTVFAPNSLGNLHSYLRPLEVRAVVIGLDTIPDFETLGTRVNGDNTRLMTAADFAAERELVRKYSDVILEGNAEVVRIAAHECLMCMQYPGTLTDGTIRALGAAMTLLTQFDASSVQSASYDLHLGDEYWCKGKRGILTENSNTLQIPAYSYVLVTAKEEARLPKFVHARFDLKVSLFFDGVILSNGPQVDPGYSGNLFCLLFNCSDRAVTLRRGDHFSTIEFQTTVSPCEGYKEHYQFKTKLDDFMTNAAVGGPGGTIVERLGTVETTLSEHPLKVLAPSLTVAAVMAAICFGLLTWSFNLYSKMDDTIETANQSAKNATTSEQKAAAHEQAVSAALAQAQKIGAEVRQQMMNLCGGEKDTAKCDATFRH